MAAEYGGGPWGRVDAENKYLVPYAAAVSEELVVVYAPDPREVLLKLDHSADYKVTYFDPVSGRTQDGGPLRHSIVRPPAGASDWVALLRRTHR